MLFIDEKYSISEVDFLEKLNLISDENTQRLKELFVYIYQSACQLKRSVLYYYNEYSYEADNTYDVNTVRCFKYTIRDKYIDEIQDKLQELRDYISILDIDVHLVLDKRYSDYTIEFHYNVEKPEKSRLVLDNVKHKLQCIKYSEEQEQYLYSFYDTYSREIFMYGDMQPYMMGRGRCFPMSLKYIFGVFDNASFDMLSVLLKWYSQFGIVFKDILSDYQNGCTEMPPFSLNEIISAHNRRELIEIKLTKTKNIQNRQCYTIITILLHSQGREVYSYKRYTNTL